MKTRDTTETHRAVAEMKTQVEVEGHSKKRHGSLEEQRRKGVREGEMENIHKTRCPAVP